MSFAGQYIAQVVAQRWAASRGSMLSAPRCRRHLQTDPRRMLVLRYDNIRPGSDQVVTSDAALTHPQTSASGSSRARGVVMASCASRLPTTSSPALATGLRLLFGVLFWAGAGSWLSPSARC